MDAANDEYRRSAKSDGTASTQKRALLHSDKHEDDSSHERKSWWQAFATIFTCLAIGLVLAIGHHFMNSYLHGRPVASVPVPQAWIFRFGTAFAFSVKMLFAISVSAAYAQYQWFQFRRRSFRVDEIDSLTSILGDPTRLFSNAIFLHQPILLLVALVVWTLPLAAVVTPGSLTVEAIRRNATSNLYVPEPMFNSTSFGHFSNIDTPLFVTSPLIYRLAYNAASAGQPVALSFENQNESYSLTFDGPAVQCAPAADWLIRNQTLTYGSGSLNQESGVIYKYVSWVPGAMPAIDSYHQTYAATLDRHSDDASRILVMTNTAWWNQTIPQLQYNISRPVVMVNVTECQLYNASYEVDFIFNYPNQTRHVAISKWLNPVSASNLYSDRSPTLNMENANIFSYSSMMQAFGQLLVGQALTSQYQSAVTSVQTSWQIMDIDWLESSAIQSGLESLFQNLTLSLLGSNDLTKPRSDTDPVPVTVTTYPITYTYAEWELLTAYGVAFAFALLCAAVGTFAFSLNRASYQNIFSSYLRAASSHEVHDLLGSNGDGSNPLPASQAKVRITMGGQQAKGG